MNELIGRCKHCGENIRFDITEGYWYHKWSKCGLDQRYCDYDEHTVAEPIEEED